MKFTIVALASVLITAIPGTAHEVEKGPNGGRVVEAGSNHIELVVNANGVERIRDRCQRQAGFNQRIQGCCDFHNQWQSPAYHT